MQHANIGHGAVQVQCATSAHKDLVALVQDVTFGSEGLTYQRLDVQSQLARFNAPTFFHALLNDQLLGVYVLDKRCLQLGDQSLDGYYRGVLAVNAQWRGKGVGKLLTEAARAWLAGNALDSPIISYGCIDQSNHRSLGLLESGGATTGAGLSMYMMYRQWPSVCCDLSALKVEHHDQIDAMTDELYARCLVRDVSPSTLPGYVLQDEHGVVVSAKLAITRFRITGMSNIATWCTRLFVKPFAPARKRFDTQSFRYVCFSEVVIRPGCESRWADFVSTALALHNCYFGVVYVDPQSELFVRLQKSHLLNRFVHSQTGSIKVVWQAYGATADNKTVFDDKLKPLHLWPVDA